MNKKDFDMLLELEPILFDKLAAAAAKFAAATAGTTCRLDRFKVGNSYFVTEASRYYETVNRLIIGHECINDSKRLWVNCHALGQWHWPSKDRDYNEVLLEDLFKKAGRCANATFGGEGPDIDWSSLEAR